MDSDAGAVGRGRTAIRHIDARRGAAGLRRGSGEAAAAVNTIEIHPL